MATLTLEGLAQRVREATERLEAIELGGGVTDHGNSAHTPDFAEDGHSHAGNHTLASHSTKPWVATSNQAITAVGDAILANSPTITISADGDYTLTSAPTIADGADGQQLTIINEDAGSDDVTLQDEGILSGSNLRLGAASRQLKAGGDSIKLTFDATVGAWVETAYTQLVAVTPLILSHTVDVGAGAASSQNKEVSSGATDPATFAWTYQGTPSAGTIDVSAGGDPGTDWPATILTPFLSLVAPAFNEGTPGVTRTFTPSITVNGDVLTSPTATVTYLNRRYVGPHSDGAQLLTAEILTLDDAASGQSGLSNSKLGTFNNIDTVAGEHIYYCYRSALGTVSWFSVENEAAKFIDELTMTHINDLGYSETFQQYRSENTNLGANKDFRALSSEANNRIFIGPAVNGTELITNAQVLALDDTGDGQSRIGSTPGFTYTTIRTETGTGEYLWYCHPDRVADLTSIKDDSTGFAIGGAYRDNITFTNQWGYQETYRCWRSTNAEILDHAPNVTVT